MKVKIDFSVIRDDEDVELEIYGEFTPGGAGSWECPPDPPEVHIDKICLDDMPWDGELTSDEVVDAEKALMEEEPGPDSGTDEYRENKMMRDHDIYDFDDGDLRYDFDDGDVFYRD